MNQFDFGLYLSYLQIHDLKSCKSILKALEMNEKTSYRDMLILILSLGWLVSSGAFLVLKSVSQYV